MNLDELDRLLAKPAEAIFGDDPDSNLKRLLRWCHPDKFEYKSDDAARAVAIFQQFNAKHASLTASVIINSKKRSYEVSADPLHKGDIADYFTTKDELLLKITRRETTNSLMEQEARVCRSIREDCHEKVRQYIPKILDQFLIRQRSRPKRTCTVFEYNSELVSIANVLDKYPNGVGPRHVAWIYNRLLTTMAITHDAGWVHGAILPRHFLVLNRNHGGVLIEWIHSVKIGDVIKTISKGNSDFYAPEVLKKRPATPETDIYMSARLMLHI